MFITRIRAACLGASLILVSAAPSFADADDVAWIKRCVSDNADQGQSAETISVYCTCMNSKMSSTETLSITAWEKTHPVETEACSKQASWKK